MLRRDNSNSNSIHTELENMSVLRSELDSIIENGNSAISELNKNQNIFEGISEELISTGTELEENLRSISALESQIIKLQDDLSNKRSLDVDYKEKISKLETEKGNHAQLIEVISEKRDNFHFSFEQKKNEIANQQIAIINAIESGRRRKRPGPEALPIDLSKISSDVNGITALGDIHGWAPGLFNFLVERRISKVAICGLDWQDFSNELNFKWRPTEITYRSPPGLDGSPYRPNSAPTLFGEIEIIPESLLERPRLILLGDLIDRGDHSELVVESVRQLVHRSSGSCIVLIGNHEEMVITDSYENWELNERKYLYDQGVKNRPFTVSHDPKVTGESDLESSFKANFKAIRASVGAFLITQHFTLLNSLNRDDRKRLELLMRPTWEKLNIKERKLQEKVKEGGWGLYSEGLSFLESICKVADSEPMLIPGALVSWYERGNFFLHAEPNGIYDINHKITNETAGLGGMKKPWNIGMHQVRFQFAAIQGNSDGRIIISQGGEGGLLWARSKDEESVAKGVEILQELFPDLENIIHGHTAQKAVSKQIIGTKKGKVTIHNIDESIGPNPRFDREIGEEYNTNIVPKGWVY